MNFSAARGRETAAFVRGADCAAQRARRVRFGFLFVGRCFRFAIGEEARGWAAANLRSHFGCVRGFYGYAGGLQRLGIPVITGGNFLEPRGRWNRISKKFSGY